jgi:LDH2 family malate/lactate/ureidoglycolate dehydrogenase
MKVNVQRIPNEDTYRLTIDISSSAFGYGKLNLGEAFNEAGMEFAKQWVSDNQSEILKNIDPVAVANLATAESAKLIRQSFIDPKDKSKK